MKIKYYITAFLLLCANLLFADPVQFTASVSKTQVGTAEPFEVTFSVNGNGDRFTPPDFKGFQVLSGPNVSTSMTSINGNTTVSNSYSYDLVAVKEGDYTIGAAFMVVNGHRLGTQAIKIKVVKGRAVQQNSRAQNVPDQSVTESRDADLSKSLFIKAVVNKTNIYQGEQLTLSYRLYTRVSLQDSRVDKSPDLNGFWSEDVKTQQQAQWRVETYKGVKYNVADVKQTILFPEHAGNLTIDPFEMTFLVRVPAAASNNIFDDFFDSYKEVKYQVKSKPVTIQVKPLPEAGKPEGFAGAVGNFTVEANLDKKELKANEPLNYTVKVSGSGNLKLLKTLSTNFPAEFEKYDPKLTDNIISGENGLSGSRTYDYLLIPRQAGDFKLDPLHFSYFNPATGRYVVLAVKSFDIKVNKGVAENNVTTLAAANQQDVKTLNKDIQYIKTGKVDLSKDGDGFYGSAGYLLLLLAGPVACIVAFLYRNKMRKENSDVVKVKSRKAGKEAARHLAHAEKQLHNRDEFYEAVFKGLYGYLSDKLNISVADLNRDTIISNLKSRAVDDQLINQLIGTLGLCEMARYAPVTKLSEQEVLEKAKNIINNIENEI